MYDIRGNARQRRIPQYESGLSNSEADKSPARQDRGEDTQGRGHLGGLDLRVRWLQVVGDVGRIGSRQSINFKSDNKLPKD